VTRGTLSGEMSLYVFDTSWALYDFSPSLAMHVQKIRRVLGDVGEHSDLGEQILMTTIPVLTDSGIEMKTSLTDDPVRNAILIAVDNYTPVSTIAVKVAEKASMALDEVKKELRRLEQEHAIYPIFPKVGFLVNCVRNQIPFKLKEYLVASELVPQE